MSKKQFYFGEIWVSRVQASNDINQKAFYSYSILTDAFWKERKKWHKKCCEKVGVMQMEMNIIWASKNCVNKIGQLHSKTFVWNYSMSESKTTNK